jgi:hypothetical protein
MQWQINAMHWCPETKHVVRVATVCVVNAPDRGNAEAVLNELLDLNGDWCYHWQYQHEYGGPREWNLRMEDRTGAYLEGETTEEAERHYRSRKPNMEEMP